MSKRLELAHLRAQIESIDSMIGNLSESNIVARYTLTQRRQRVIDEIAGVEASLTRTANVVLFFDGRPVHGSHGIDAGFSGEAVTHYNSLVTHLAKGQQNDDTPSKMLLTNIVHGSFGLVWWVWIQHSGHREGKRIQANDESVAAQMFVNGAYTDELFPNENNGDTCTICVAPFADGIAEREEEPPHETFGYRLKIRYEVERC